jgi:phage tail protein X
MLAAAIGPARAQNYVTGNEWYALCTNSNGGPQLGCVTYARGIADGFLVWQQVLPNNALVCLPDNSVANQLRDVGLKYIKQHPETRDQWIGELLLRAYAEAWPCKRGGGNK